MLESTDWNHYLLRTGQMPTDIFRATGLERRGQSTVLLHNEDSTGDMPYLITQSTRTPLFQFTPPPPYSTIHPIVSSNYQHRPSFHSKSQFPVQHTICRWKVNISLLIEGWKVFLNSVQDSLDRVWESLEISSGVNQLEYYLEELDH